MRSDEKTIEHIIRRMQTDKAIDAPDDALCYAKNIFRTRVVEHRPSAIERILAVMRIDMEPDRAAFGERSARQGEARQMLFEAGDHAVDLRIKALEKGVEVRGQILGAGFENGQAILSSGTASITTPVNEMSDFKFADVPAGEHTLTVRSGDLEIVIDSLIIN